MGSGNRCRGNGCGRRGRQGRRGDRDRVGRTGREAGLGAAHSRRRGRRGRPDTAPAADLLERDFTAEASDQRWVGDITQFSCVDGALYLAGILDLHDRGLAGWSMGQRQTTDLVIGALVMALGRRHPDEPLISHQDRGSQYPAIEFSNRLADWNMKASYGSTGDCFDNAAIESFWGALKRELRHVHGDIGRFTRSEMRTILFDHIEVFYNRQRHQAGLEHRTPAEVYAAAVA